MFWNASAIKGYTVFATDGDVGHVVDILIDDVAWTVRWLEVETGNWLNRHTVCLPLWALNPPDPKTHILTVALNRAQIGSSPEADGDGNLSQDHEAKISEHYASLCPLYAQCEPASQGEKVLIRPAQVGPSQNLVSLNGLRNSTVDASDGEIGHVESLLVDTRTWTIKYLVVHTSDWWADKKVLILPDTIERIDYVRGRIDLRVTREKVRGSPDFVAEETIDGAFDEQFHIYYGIKWMKK